MTKKTEDTQMTYEQAMKRLETIADQLEKGECGLADQLALFEEGVHLSKRCQAELDQVEERLKQLTSDGEEMALDGR